MLGLAGCLWPCQALRLIGTAAPAASQCTIIQAVVTTHGMVGLLLSRLLEDTVT